MRESNQCLFHSVLTSLSNFKSKIKKQGTARNFVRWLRDKTQTQVHWHQHLEDVGAFLQLIMPQVPSARVSLLSPPFPDPHTSPTGSPLRCYLHCWFNPFWWVTQAFTEESSALLVAHAYPPPRMSPLGGLYQLFYWAHYHTVKCLLCF